jgi:hypothetical protein
MYLIKANDNLHKYIAIFPDKRIPFGNVFYEDYTQHHDDERKRLYLLRHQNEDWENPYTAGALSRWLLWNTKSLRSNLDLFKKKFNV